MRQPKTSIAPEVEHLLAAVKAVKEGLVPERKNQPIHEDTEVNQEQDYEQEESET